jgi:hypothetical protein
MWVKTDKGSFRNLDNGTTLAVRASKDRKEHRVVAISHDEATTLFAVQGGYTNKDDAQDALQGLMDSMDEKVLEIKHPDDYVPEEDEEEDDTEE